LGLPEPPGSPNAHTKIDFTPKSRKMVSFFWQDETFGQSLRLPEVAGFDRFAQLYYLPAVLTVKQKSLKLQQVH